MRTTKPLLISAGLFAFAIFFAAALIMFAPKKKIVAADNATGAATAVPAGPNAPGEVLLLRHAEEPKSGPDLSDQGRARADALVSLFQHPLTQPSAIFAAKSSKQSARPVQTCEPLAKAIGINVDARFDENEFKALATAILRGNGQAGGSVVVCWKRETMPELAAALGVANPPVEWPSNQYDHFWRITYSGGKATMKDENQGLTLPGTEK